MKSLNEFKNDEKQKFIRAMKKCVIRSTVVT